MAGWSSSLSLTGRKRLAVTTSFIVVVLWVLVPLPAASQEIEFERDLAKRMLGTLSTQVEGNFYDRELGGLDWKELTRQAGNQIENADSAVQMLTAIHSLISKLQDSHTHFIPPRRTIKRRFGFEAMAFGDIIRIHAIHKNGAAAAAGLQVGDRLLKINGFNVTRDTFNSIMLSSRVVMPVDVMEMTYYRDNNPARIVRVPAQITNEAPLRYVNSIEDIHQVVKEAEPSVEAFRYSESVDGVGYLYIPFVPADKSILLRLINKARKARALKLDLRGNAGGSVEAMLYLAGFFESQPAIIADMVGRTGTKALELKPQRPHLSGPLFILVDSQTASSGEILARHFQRTGRALVIGDRTAGRVSASRVFWNHIGSKVVISYWVQVAVARIVLPGGEELERKGINPDHLCIPGSQDLREHHDLCRVTALVLARKALTGPGRP